jgi:hypothetical protein
MLSDRPAIALRQPADQRTDILARLQPRLGPGETRPQRNQQLPAPPRTQACPYPGSRSRLRGARCRRPDRPEPVRQARFQVDDLANLMAVLIRLGSR